MNQHLALALKMSAQACQLNADFPDLAVVQLYLAPCTTNYTTPPAAFVPVHSVDSVSLALFCEQNFVWADASGIL